MNPRASTAFRLSADLLILAATFAAALWAASSKSKEIDRALGLKTFEMPVWEMSPWGQTPEQAAEAKRPLREKYARLYPGSFLAWLNRHPFVVTVEKTLARLQAASLPFLAVASVGVGLVAIRRTPGSRRRRPWSVGSVSGLVALVISGSELVNEFVLRRWNFSSRGDYHYELSGLWLYVLADVGIAMTLAWALMAASGRWRAGRGWRERLGFALGLAWLLAYSWQIIEPIAQVYG